MTKILCQNLILTLRVMMFPIWESSGWMLNAAEPATFCLHGVLGYLRRDPTHHLVTSAPNEPGSTASPWA